MMELIRPLTPRNVPEIDDADPNICVSIVTHNPVIIVKPTSFQNHMSMMVKVVLERDRSITCGESNQREFFAMTKMYQPFGIVGTGTFRKCDLMLDETNLNDYVFNCTCFMQYCQYVYFMVQPTCSVRVCSITIIWFCSLFSVSLAPPKCSIVYVIIITMW